MKDRQAREVGAGALELKGPTAHEKGTMAPLGVRDF